ncbi:MAG: PIN domain-containing protein [Blastochloris sp.]|nr:PIN domain-containing protein [Blastochloris sp.]
MERGLVLLLDTNIWLERLLGQAQSATVGRLLDAIPSDQLMMSNFTLHSLGVILNRLGHRAVLLPFVQDVLIDGAVALVSLPPVAMYRVIAVMEQYGLDFDDAYQYVAAEREDAVMVSFDGHFDQTPRGRQTPAQVLTSH